MKKFLLDKRDYHPDPETTKSVFKETKFGKVIIDLANRGDDIFEGKQEKFHLNIVDGNIEIKDLEGQRVPVPSRSVLLMMKIKAAWDRSWRVRNNKGDRIEWDRSKMIKDHSDILALLEPDKHEDELNITRSAPLFEKIGILNLFCFLILLTQQCKESVDYGRRYISL